MVEPMNVLDKFNRANTPHPSATLTPSPQGEGLSLTEAQRKPLTQQLPHQCKPTKTKIDFQIKIRYNNHYYVIKSEEKMSIKRSFAKYVSLNILGMTALSLYILADTYFVAQGIGSDGLAALNIAIPVFSLIVGTGLMIGMGGATRFSISRTDTIFTRALCFGVIASAAYFI
ncbi:MAG: hypothetical protein ACI4RP_02140, partial [Acutalibacteraceae bacterium]